MMVVLRAVYAAMLPWWREGAETGRLSRAEVSRLRRSAGEWTRVPVHSQFQSIVPVNLRLRPPPSARWEGTTRSPAGGRGQERLPL
jgi:hypothetical protein